LNAIIAEQNSGHWAVTPRNSVKIRATLDSVAGDAHIPVSGCPSGFYRRCHYHKNK